jgi:hypothetical protein
LPQPPQLDGSVSGSTQLWPHPISPAPQPETHAPVEHERPMAHFIPQLPQLLGSVPVSVQAPHRRSSRMRSRSDRSGRSSRRCRPCRSRRTASGRQTSPRRRRCKPSGPLRRRLRRPRSCTPGSLPNKRVRTLRSCEGRIANRCTRRRQPSSRANRRPAAHPDWPHRHSRLHPRSGRHRP